MPFGRLARAIGELAGQPGLAGGALARDLSVLPAPQPLLGALDDALQQQVGGGGVGREPVVEVIAERALHHAPGLGRGQTLLGLPLELRLAQEDGEERAGAARHVVRVELGRALVAHERAVGPEAPHQRGPHARLVTAACAGGHGVAVGGDEALVVVGPGDGPLDPAGIAVERALAGEGRRRQRVALAEDGGQIVDQAARIVQHRLLRRRVVSRPSSAASQDQRISTPRWR